MKVFLDTNIFLNVLLAESDCHDCLRIINGWKKSGGIDEAVTSYLSLANIAYVLRKRIGKDKVAPTIQSIMEYITDVTNSQGAEYHFACALRGPDFEDILQYTNARFNNCDIFITCNKPDFQRIADPDKVLGSTGLTILNPAEFIEEFFQPSNVSR